MGNVNGRGTVTRTACNDCETVADNLFDEDARAVNDAFTAYSLYIDPSPAGPA